MKPKEMTLEEREERLWKHLLKLERLTGMPLRKRPRSVWHVCPIENFAPNKDKTWSSFYNVEYSGYVHYTQPRKVYDIYESNDSDWWESLKIEDCRDITRRLIKRLKER